MCIRLPAIMMPSMIKTFKQQQPHRLNKRKQKKHDRLTTIEFLQKPEAQIVV